MRRVTGTVGPLAIGVSVLWLSIIVLLPLAALTFTALSGGLGEFWDAVTAPAALAALRVTLGTSAVVALFNVVMGTLVAWVLVRDDFRGKSLVNALIDLPFALPTIVASIVLLSLYGPEQPGRGAPQRDDGRPGRRPRLRDAALRGPRGAAGPHRGRPGGRGGGGLARREQLDGLPSGPPADPWLPRSSAAAGSRSRGRSASTGSVVLIGGNIPGVTQVVVAVHPAADRDRPAGSTPPPCRSRCSSSPSWCCSPLRLVAGAQRRREEKAP